MTRRERRPALAALAVLLIIGGALVSAMLVIRSGDRESVIAIARPVAAGQRIPPDALREVQVSADSGVATVPWAQRGEVVRFYAKVGLVPGALLSRQMVAAGADIGGGNVVVGLALKPGQLPAAGLRPGDRVRAYAVRPVGSAGQSDQGGTVLADSGTVYDVRSDDRMRAGSSGTVSVSVVVPAGDAPALANAASAGAVAVALLPPNAAPGATQPDAEPGGTQPG
ncbi:MAG: hypothetical protein GEV11_10490, partial [Streptosporangiales bacterium]|nr:hypothetical protein [Streptosporangiales bacterium]